MSTVTDYLNKVSDISEYINKTDPNLDNNLQNLTKLLYEYGQNEKSYKKSTKKSRNLHNNLLVTEDFGHDEIWYQIKDHSQTVLSTVDQRSKYRKNERQRIQQIIQQLQNDSDTQIDTTQQFINDNDTDTQNDTPSNNDSDISHQQDIENENDINNDWIDVIKDHRAQQIEANKVSNNDIDEKQEDNNDDDVLDYDSFQKQTDEMEAFINKQWEKEKEMAEDGVFDLLNENIEERALIFDEMNDNNSDENEPETMDISNKNDDKNDDAFAFLNKHIAKDSDDEITQDKNRTNDEWNDLFNLPKFSTENTNENMHKNIDNNKKQEIENLSKFELEERAIRERISKLEEENVKMRSWEYQGEVSNNKFTHPNARRNKNSLLSTYLDFDYCDKLKPQITNDLNLAINNLIITKIKNNQFDDIECKRDFVNAPKIAKRKLIEIQDTKSSMGLAELYEREYLQQIEKQQDIIGNGNEFENVKDIELTKRYERISRMKSGLFYELDQLVRFHYEPRQAIIKDNIKIKTNTQALYLEEIVPFSMTNDMTMTPEQLYRRPRKLGYIKGENEMTKKDRKNKRRNNKKRAKYWNDMRNENDKLRAKYDEKFEKHLERIKALNEVRTHAIAAVKKNGFMNNNKGNGMDMERDNMRYTSTNQVFGKIYEFEQNKLKKRKLENDNNNNNGVKGNISLIIPPEKRRKIKSMM
eukprot:499955_1